MSGEMLTAMTHSHRRTIRNPSAHHRQDPDVEHSSLAASRLLEENGYDKTSLSRTEATDMSTATLFQQFPHKAKLFESIVIHSGRPPRRPSPRPVPESGGRVGVLGAQYASLRSCGRMEGLFRLVIAEALLLELGRIQFGLGKSPFFDNVRRCREAATQHGTLQVDDPVIATTPFPA